MVSEPTIATQIRTALAQYLKRDLAKIGPGDRLREDLGLDSLAMIELLFKIEEHFDLEIPNEDLSRIVTVADVTAYVEEKLAEQAAGGGAPARPPAPASTAAPAPAPVRVAPAPAAARSAPAASGRGPVAVKPAAAARRPVTVKPAAPARPPAKVTSIKAAAKRKTARTAAKPAAKKKGSRRA
jgi:acyl carrier protein